MACFSRFISLGVLCLLLLFARSAYGTIDCPAIQGNVDLILSIGPWKCPSSFAVITTDLQLLAGTLQVNHHPSLNRLHLSPPEPLAVLEPKLYGFLHKLAPLTPSPSLIEVNNPLEFERITVLVNDTTAWIFTPSTGAKVKFTLAPPMPLSAAWCSSDTHQIYLLNGSAIFRGDYSAHKKSIRFLSGNNLEYSGHFAEADTRPLGGATKEAWQVKKAFNWGGYFYVLTRETVYFFEENVLSWKVPLFKVPYEKFFICAGAKEATKNGTAGKEAKSKKRKVTHAHLAHSHSSTVAPHLSVVAWVFSLLGGFLLLVTFVGLCLYFCLIYPQKKAETPPGRVYSSGSISFNGGLVHKPSRTGDAKVKMAPSKEASVSVNSKLVPGGLRVPTKVNVDVAKRQAARLAAKQACNGAQKVKRESSKVQGASDKTK